MWIIWARRFSWIFAAAVAVCILYSQLPETCALCESARYHGPCLLNLSTGEAGELTVYDPNPVIAGELAKEQRKGFFSYVSCAGLKAARDTANWTTVIRVPEDAKEMRQSHFCKSCRRLLRDYRQNGYVLADLYREGNPVIYPIADQAVYEIRRYKVEVRKDGAFHITVQGLWRPEQE